MKLLDERGIGTVWSICKEKFALVGHTHNYAGSGSPGGSANSAIGVVDYNSPDDIIQIGISGPGISGDEIAYIAGYVNNPGNVGARIKDVSKDALRSWLELRTLAYESSVDWSMISDIPTATTTQSGIMSAADKSKLNGIASGANNYSLPVASETTLGGIKVSDHAVGAGWPICVDENGLVETKINGLEKRNNAVKSIVVHGNAHDATSYSYKAITVDCYSGNNKLISLPSESGTLALTSDIPTKTSQLTNDSGFLKQRDFECNINIYLTDTQLSYDKLKGANITIEQQGEDVMYAIWDGSPISFTANAKVKIKISVSHVNGYITPNAVEFKTVIGRDEDITLTYTPITLGVYIYDTDGHFTLPDNWDSTNNSKAVGVYVGTENSQFVIAPTYEDNTRNWGAHGTVFGTIASNDSVIAKKDYAGEANTNKIIAQLKIEESPAVQYCRNYTFKNGKKGYLWSLGEACEVYNNRVAIDKAMIKIGGYSIYSAKEEFWTSTQFSSLQAWTIDLSGISNHNCKYRDKQSGHYVRAVCYI